MRLTTWGEPEYIGRVRGFEGMWGLGGWVRVLGGVKGFVSMASSRRYVRSGSVAQEFYAAGPLEACPCRARARALEWDPIARVCREHALLTHFSLHNDQCHKTQPN